MTEESLIEKIDLIDVDTGKVIVKFKVDLSNDKMEDLYGYFG